MEEIQVPTFPESISEGTITKWNGDTGIMYSKAISETNGVVDFYSTSQQLDINYRYDNKTQVRLFPILEKII